MEKDGMKEIFDIVEEKLSGLDSITRREVLKKLLKSSAFLALLTGGGLGMLTPSLTGAVERKYISREALTSPVPDRDFKLTRTHLLDGFNAALIEMMEEAIGEALRQVEDLKNMEIPIPYVFGSSEVGSSDTRQCPSDCNWQGCTDNMCAEQNCPRNTCSPTNSCSGQDCHWNVCRPVNTCGSQGCPTHGGCEGSNVCDGQGCGSERQGECTQQSECQQDVCEPRQSQSPCGRDSQTWVDPKDLLDRYSDQPFVTEMKELFGNNVLREIEGMIRNKTTLRGRGLIGPGAPIPSTRSLDDMLRDMPGARMQKIPAQPPTTPTAPATTTPPPATTPSTPPPATEPVTPPPATTPTPVGPRPTIRPGTTPVAPTPITPRPIP